MIEVSECVRGRSENVETRGQMFNPGLVHSSPGDLRRAGDNAVSMPRHPGFAPESAGKSQPRENGYNMYLVSLRNLINEKMQSIVRIDQEKEQAATAEILADNSILCG